MQMTINDNAANSIFSPWYYYSMTTWFLPIIHNLMTAKRMSTNDFFRFSTMNDHLIILIFY